MRAPARRIRADSRDIESHNHINQPHNQPSMMRSISAIEAVSSMADELTDLDEQLLRDLDKTAENEKIRKQIFKINRVRFSDKLQEHIFFLETSDARKADGCNAAKSDAYQCFLWQHLSRRVDVPAETSLTCKKIHIFIDLKIQFTPSPSNLLYNLAKKSCLQHSISNKTIKSEVCL